MPKTALAINSLTRLGRIRETVPGEHESNMGINSLDELDKLEWRIGQKIGKFRLGDVLYSLYGRKNELPPFIAAGVALFAVRFSPPSIVTQDIKLVNIQPIIQLVYDYLLAEPITFDRELHDVFIGSNPIFLILRVVCSQFPFDVSRFSQFARPILLYNEIPKSLTGQKGIPKFDLQKEFKNINGISISEFISIGFVLSAFASNRFTFSFDFLRKTRSQGINLPNDKVIFRVINCLAGAQFNIQNLYEKRKNSDRRFRMYDFNPLRQYPLIFPCKSRGFKNSGQDFMCAPVPALIDERISIGVFYQLFNTFGQNFSDYFGYILEEYLKLILSNSINLENLIDIRNLSLGNNKKSPDYAVIDGNIAIVFECKATRFTLPAQTISSEEAINYSLKQVKKGLIQLNDFIEACHSKSPSLYQFHQCTIFKPIFVSLEPLYLINADWFRNHVNELLRNEGITSFNWQILSIDELEKLQPHLVQGIRLSQVIQDLENKTFNYVLEQLCLQTNKTYKDSFLYPKQEEIYQSLGIPDKSE